MKFTENTQISEIIDLIHNDWKSFKQDLKETVYKKSP